MSILKSSVCDYLELCTISIKYEVEMNTENFVQNVKKFCAIKGVKPTVACAESGAGKDLLGQLTKRGTIPSVERVQLLAQYLGCTVSDLLGERPADMEPGNVIVYADRNGETRKTKIVSDAQFAAIAKILDSLPEEKDDL